jgi:phage protein U
LIVGALGDFIFEASANVVKTLDDFEWSSAAKFGKHERHLAETLLEFTGTDPDDISFKVHLNESLGVDPEKEYTELLKAERAGKVMTLVIGEKIYGKGKWVIVKSKRKPLEYGKGGKPSVLEVSLSLMAYA